MKDTNQLIADALRDIADEARVPMPSADTAWRAGRRRRVATLAVPAVCVAGVIALVVALTVPSTPARGPAPAAAVPSTRLVSLTLSPAKPASVSDLTTAVRLLDQRITLLRLPDTQARVVGPDIVLTGPDADKAQLMAIAAPGVLDMREVLLWKPSPSISTTYGNAKLVNHNTLKLFHKLVCTPKNASTWENQVGYASAAGYDNPDTQIVLCDRSGNKYALDVAKVTGAQVDDATAVLSPTDNMWTVTATLNRAGAAAFGTLTAKLYQKYYPGATRNMNDAELDSIAFVLDGNLIIAPLTAGVISDGMLQIIMSSQVQAADIAAQLRTGPLPVDFRIVNLGAGAPAAGAPAASTSAAS